MSLVEEKAEKEKRETFKNFVNGEWKGSRNGATFENENPALRGSNIALFQSSTTEDVREAIDVADNAFKTWKRTSVAPAMKLAMYPSSFHPVWI